MIQMTPAAGIFPYIFRILSISRFFVSGVFAVSADFFDTLRCVIRFRISPTISAWLLINLIDLTIFTFNKNAFMYVAYVDKEIGREVGEDRKREKER